MMDLVFNSESANLAKYIKCLNYIKIERTDNNHFNLIWLITDNVLEKNIGNWKITKASQDY